MALHSWAFIFLSPDFDATQHVATLQSSTCRFKTVGINMKNKEEVITVAKQLVAEGVQVIELCGGFGPHWINAVSEAINHVIPVGGVFYGPEARQPMLTILA